MNKINGAGILLFTEINKKKYLILYKARNKNYYEDLGGRIDEGDDVYKTASREAYEESATYINLNEYDLYDVQKIYLKKYICFIKGVNNFSIQNAKILLDKYKNKKHYNEMDDVKIVPVVDLISSIKNKKPLLPLRNRLLEILNNLYQL